MAKKREAQLYRLRALLLKNWWLKMHHGYLGIALEVLFPVIIVRIATSTHAALILFHAVCSLPRSQFRSCFLDFQCL